MNESIAITGASGFIGRVLVKSLVESGIKTIPLIRQELAAFPTARIVGDIDPKMDWKPALDGVNCVIHCAGRAHVLNETAANPLEEFRRINRDAALKLAKDAHACGVRRMIFISSIGVMGIHTNDRVPFSAFDEPNPSWDYAVSKYEAEVLLREFAASSGLELVIVRPPMVYGPNVPANFLRLLKIVKLGTILPLANVHNRRSMIGIENLVDFLRLCISHPHADGQTFMISDGQDLSTPELIRTLARYMQRPARLVPFPVAMLKLAGRMAGRGHDVERLIGSLEVDIDHTRRLLGWSPPVSVDTGLRATVDWFRTSMK